MLALFGLGGGEIKLIIMLVIGLMMLAVAATVVGLILYFALKKKPEAPTNLLTTAPSVPPKS